jgi:competence protein ComEC
LQSAFSFLLGTLAAFAWPWPMGRLGFIAALLAAAALAWGRRRGFAALLCGFALCGLAVERYHELRWPVARTDERVLVHATVASIPRPTVHGVLFDARLAVVRGGPATELRAELLWRTPPRLPHAGERWQLLVRLRPPERSVNPGSDDPARIAFRERRHASGVVLDSRLNRCLEVSRRALGRLRERLFAGIRERVLDRDAAALLGALAVGHTGEMSREQWRVFNATGTTHLVAISGLHVTFFALVALVVARRLWRPLAGRLLHVPRESFAAAAALLMATGYALLAGFSVPTQRTLVMLAAWLGARASARPAGGARAFSLALIAVLLFDPFAPLAAGFWLSFIAVGAILLATNTPLVVPERTRLLAAARAQIAVFLALAPATLAIFGNVSLAGLPVNVVAIPVFSFVLVPLVLLATLALLVAPSAAAPVLAAAEAIHEWGWPLLSAAADWPLANVVLNPPLWWYALALASTLVLAPPWSWKWRLSGLLVAVPLLAPAGSTLARHEVDLVFFDVGRGTAVAVRTASSTVLFGNGEVHGSEGGRTERVLVPWLRSAGVRKVDYLVLGGVTPDRAAGAAVLESQLAIGSILTANPWRGALLPARLCGGVEPWSADGVTFTPLQGRARGPRGRNSCSLAIRAGSVRLLLTGELEAIAAAELLDALRARGLTPVDIVLAPRNGSDLASSQAFVAGLDPRRVVISAPRTYEHAARSRVVIDRWRATGAAVHVTGAGGAIRVTVRGEEGSIRVEEARGSDPWPWRREDRYHAGRRLRSGS